MYAAQRLVEGKKGRCRIHMSSFSEKKFRFIFLIWSDLSAGVVFLYLSLIKYSSFPLLFQLLLGTIIGS